MTHRWQGVACVLLSATLHALRRPRAAPSSEAPLTGRDLPWLAAVIATGGVAGPVLLMVGLSATPASTASLLLNLEGL